MNLFESDINSIINVVRKPIKNLYIRLYPDGRVVVSAPYHLSQENIQEFINSKTQWIAKKQLHMAERQERYPQVQPAQPDKIPTELVLWGERYPLNYQRGGKNTVVIKDNVGLITHRGDICADTIQRIVTAYQRQCLLQRIQTYVERYQLIIGVQVNEVRTKRMKTKWGTCNITARRLWFNVGLAQLPPRCTEYVVVHEMTHLLERYHNRRFYDLVGKAMPDWRQWHDYLKNTSL